METQELHRGRLIDHIQLVVKDLPASQTFYTAVFVLDPVVTILKRFTTAKRSAGSVKVTF
jgi:catechol-2,3-dioxygenase